MGDLRVLPEVEKPQMERIEVDAKVTSLFITTDAVTGQLSIKQFGGNPQIADAVLLLNQALFMLVDKSFGD